MTKTQIQNTIIKEFKRRLRQAYGKWTDMYELSVKKYASCCDVVELTFKTDFHSISINFDACLNINVRCEGAGTIACILRCFIDVAEDCEKYIHWLLSKDRLHRITFEGRND